MSAKRRAEKQMTRDDLDRDDSPEREEVEVGIQIAPKEVLANRVIKTARRSLPHTPQDSKPSPFASTLAGLKTGGAFTPNFSAFAGLAAKPAEIVASNPVPQPTAKLNGISKDVSGDVAEEEFERDKEYNQKLKSLNKAFQSHINEYMLKGPDFDFSNVCTEYKNHHQQLADKYPLVRVKKSEEPAVTPKPFSTQTNLFTPQATFSSNPTTLSFPINGSPAKTADVPTPFSSSQPIFSSSKPADVPAPFSSSQPIFNFKSVVSTAPTDPPSQGAENDNEDNYEPPKPEAVVIEEEGALFSKPDIKVYYKQLTDPAFVAYGRGTLYIKELDGGKKQLIVRANNTLGTILLNILWVSAIPVNLKKKDIFFGSIPNPPINGKESKELVSYLLRSKNEEEAKELSEKLIEYKS